MATFLGAADHWLGVLAGAAGRFAEAAAHLEAALARHQAMGSRPLTALTQEAYGRVLSVRGQRGRRRAGRARSPQSALRTADELGLAAITAPGPRGRADAPLAERSPRYVRSRNPAIERVHVGGGPGPDDRVEVGVPGEHLPLVVALRVL